jgi:hypothetical protein
MTETQELTRPGASLRLYRNAPSWDGLRCAALGGLEFDDRDGASQLVAEAIDTLRREGFGGLLGPMDGDTWHSYRTITESDGSPAFALEPKHGVHDHAVLQAAGFEPVSTYASSRARLADTLGTAPVSMPGITVAAWDGTGAEHLIGRLFAMSGRAFASNHFFKPIELDAFLAFYRPIMPMLDPRHILFARTDAGDLVGFLFGYPDRLARDTPAAVLKTYATSLRGVGHLLADQYHRRAMAMGHQEVIHALMHDANVSKERSILYNAQVFRRYALMGLRL